MVSASSPLSISGSLALKLSLQRGPTSFLAGYVFYVTAHSTMAEKVLVFLSNDETHLDKSHALYLHSILHRLLSTTSYVHPVEDGTIQALGRNTP